MTSAPTLQTDLVSHARDGASRFERVFGALERLAAAPHGVTLSDLARDLDLSPSSAHDLLRGLVDAQVVSRHGRRYTLGPRAVGLAVSIVDSLDFLAAAREAAADLSAATGEDVLVATRMGSTVGYAYKHPGSTPLKVAVTIGEPRPLHATSVGKLYAAFCEDLRTELLSGGQPLYAYTPQTIISVRRLARELKATAELRFAVSNGESIEGVVGFAAPIFDVRGELVAALHVSLPSQRCDAQHLTAIVTSMVEKAAAVTKDVGGSPAQPPPDLPARVLERVTAATLPTTESVPH